MFAFMNAESLAHTLKTRKATYWSRSRNKLWMKGEESGNVQQRARTPHRLRPGRSALKVEQTGSANASCHNGYKSCFYRKLADLDDGSMTLKFTAEPLFDPATVYKKK